MGCNAWNHPSDCDCGWGGDTGGGREGSLHLRRVPIPNGRLWSFRPSYESYTVPNARCPVCSADVFFYQAPTGGRVFFDDLGPPWPKHPCTDTERVRSRKDPVLPPTMPIPRPLGREVQEAGWAPFVGYMLPQEVDPQTESYRVFNKEMGLEADRLSLPKGFIGEAPVFWRRSPQFPGWFELSTFRYEGEVLTPRTAYLPSWRVPEGMPALDPLSLIHISEPTRPY